MKLDYFSLLSPEPITLEHVGGVISPTLMKISKLRQKYNTYLSYISTLMINIESYYEIMDKMGDLYFANYTQEQKNIVLQARREYESMSKEERDNISFFNIMIFDDVLKNAVLETLRFFMTDTIVYSNEYHMFLTFNNDVGDDYSKPTGYINHTNYPTLVNIILQRICVNQNNQEENIKVKNKTAARLLEKIKQGNKKKQQKNDKKMELPNLISSLASHSKNLNIVNIWDLTVYQLYDQFRRQQLDDYYNISSSHVASWGDSDNKFDNTLWYSLINDD